MKADISGIVQDLRVNLEVVRSAMTQGDTVGLTAEQEAALATVETFCAIAVRVMRQTNPSKLRDAARAEELAAYIHNREVLK